MDGITFAWDHAKAKSNRRKHGVSFKEAATAFSDGNARLLHDRRHSSGEDRFVLLGLASSLRLLVVCHCYRQQDRVIRIISARKAHRIEQNQYWSFLTP